MTLRTVRVGALEDVFQYDDGDYNNAIETSQPISVGAPSAADHAVRLDDLTDGASLDGDKIDIDWNPTNYTPSTTPGEVDDADDLTAHLYGIDQAIGSNDTDIAARVVGPASAADNALVRFDTTSGKLVQSGPTLMNDDGDIYIPSSRGIYIDGTKVLSDQGSSIADGAAVSSISLGTGSDSVDRATFNTDLGTLVTEVNALKDKINAIISALETHGLIGV